ncbi:MAG TPA: DUF6230 family protein [Kineosporiaceae bacterium]
MESYPAVAGRIAWRRYAMIFAPAIALAAVIVLLSGKGALAASFAISGAPFKLSADTLDGTGFVSYTSVDTGADGKHHAVTPSGFATAKLTNLCQSVVSPTPFGPVTMRLTAGKTEPVQATNLVADFDQLSGDIQFTGYSNGVDAAEVSGPATGEKGGWAQQAKAIHIDKLRQHSLATTAATFILTGLNIDVSFGTNECY